VPAARWAAVTIVRIRHRASGTLLAEGPVGWGITPFEGNYYISSRYVRTQGFRTSYVPGICVYKFIYVWMDLHLEGGTQVDGLGWKYVIPNPVFPFIAFRLALPGSHPALTVERFQSQD
jgi:uncharacterized protein (DUF427 family)